MVPNPSLKTPADHWQGVLMLLVVCMLWGSAFLVVKGAIADVPASVLTFSRFAIAALCFLPFMNRNRAIFQAGFELGLWLMVGYATQTIGLEFTSVNRSAFITSLYVILLPLLTRLMGGRLSWATWGSALLAFGGVGLLSSDGSPPNVGDYWTLATALFYALYVWRLEAYSVHFNAIDLAGAQLVAGTAIAFPWVLATHPSWLKMSALANLPWPALLYLALLCTACTTWMQTWGQQRVNATQAAVILTMEPVWASLFAFLVLDEVLSMQGYLGAATVVVAMVVSQIAWLRRSRL
ncbi:MAG: DMT family transporter [Synechococcales cyanobacterium T60_A2020_003]|nr:DMT family transporter [Synechococcales cyanobacterium T60_A2020_003]